MKAHKERFKARWPQQFQSLGKTVPWNKDLGWFIFPYGDCIAIIWYRIDRKSGELIWKPRRGKRGGVFISDYDLMTIKKEKVFDVAEALKEVVGLKGITKEEIQAMRDQKKEKEAEAELESVIKRFI